MQEYTATELGTRAKEVLGAAKRAPIGVTKHGRRQFVLMSAEAYEMLLAGGDPALLPEPAAQGDLWGDDMDLFDDA